MEGPPAAQTLGWRPGCGCNQSGPDAPQFEPYPPVPTIVLDPFCGSGTVGEACWKLGRRFIGLDLSAEYLAKNAAARAERMTTGAGLAAAQVRRPKVDKQLLKMVEAGQLSLLE